jgi:hypothetical protein
MRPVAFLELLNSGLNKMALVLDGVFDGNLPI